LKKVKENDGRVDTCINGEHTTTNAKHTKQALTAKYTHTTKHSRLTFHVLHVVVQLLPGQLFPLEVFVQLRVVLLHHFGLRQLALHRLLERLGL